MLRRHVRLLGLALVTGIVLSIMVVPVVLAKGNPIFQTSPLNDRFASNAGKGADGFAKVRTTQQGSIVFDKVIAKNLTPNTAYEVHVAVTPGPDFVVAEIVASKAVTVTTNGGGVLHVRNIDLGGVAAGDYRVDVLVTPAVASANTENVGNAQLVILAGIIDRDFLLACQPAFTVTVE